LIHLDLFSGIGGFALAAEWVWGANHHIHSFVEIDPFCQKVLKKHWPDIPIHSNIKEYKHDQTQIDLLTGGFPCQPFSQAGKRGGTDDDRYLWPEMLRIIRDARPTWVIGENVGGLVTLEGGLVLENCIIDLENEGYEVMPPFIIPACAVNAPHRRDRVWIVAYSSTTGLSQSGLTRIGEFSEETKKGMDNRFEQQDCHAPNAPNRQDDRRGRGIMDKAPECGESGNASLGAGYQDVAQCNNAWDEPWLEAATRLCRVDDGLPRGLDEHSELSGEPPKKNKAAGRVQRLKALGNAIVPQVVYPIMDSIEQIENWNRRN
jgi:DNA (cytosine-5)-methyltransferase 1